jgi:hypothetical protein
MITTDESDLLLLEDTPELFQQIKATIRSTEPITLENLDKFTDSISYEKTAEVRFNGKYYTELMITVDLEQAEKDQNEYESTEEYPLPWTGNIWDWLEDGPISRMNEDNVLPASVDWYKDVELEYL